MSALTGRGTAHRLNRNMLVFLAADAKRYEELDDAVRQVPGLDGLAGTEERIRELELPPQQAAQARKRLKDADETVDLRISATYHWLLVPVQTTQQPAAHRRAQGGHEQRPARRTGIERLKNADMLRIVQGPQNIRLNLDQHLSIGLVFRAHRGRQALGVLLPVPLPAPARRPARCWRTASWPSSTR